MRQDENAAPVALNWRHSRSASGDWRNGFPWKWIVARGRPAMPGNADGGAGRLARRVGRRMGKRSVVLAEQTGRCYTLERVGLHRPRAPA